MPGIAPQDKAAKCPGPPVGTTAGTVCCRRNTSLCAGICASIISGSDEALDAYANYCAHLHQALGRVFYRDILTPFRNFDFRNARDGVARFGDECDPSNLHSDSLDIMYEQMDELHGLEVEYWFPCGYADIVSNAP